GLQHELGEIAKSDGLLLRDTALSHQKKNLGQGAVDVGGSGEVAAERLKAVTAWGIGPVRESSLVHADFVDRRKLILWVDFRRRTGRRSCSDRRFGSMMDAKFRALHLALTPVGKREFTAQGIKRG